MIAANMKPLYEKEARERQKLTQLVGDRTQAKDLLVTDRGQAPRTVGETNEIVGKMFGVSGQTVHRASAVIKNGVEELQEAVKAGKSTFQWVGGCQKYTFFVYR